MRILIFGAEGMLGTDLVSSLSGKHWIAARDIGQVDICDQGRVLLEIEAIRPQTVIHAAAYTDVDGCEFQRERAFSVNGEGTRNIALGCRKVGASMVYLSTDYVFDGRSADPYREEDLPHPMNTYGESKWKGECYVREILENYLTIRTAWLYGLKGKNFVKAVLRQAAEKRELRVVDDQRGSPTFTKDLSWGISRLVEIGATGVIHLTSSGACTWFEFAREIVRMKGIREVSVVPISSETLGRPAKRPANSVLDCSRFEKLTGRKMRPWGEALREYLAAESFPPATTG